MGGRGTSRGSTISTCRAFQNNSIHSTQVYSMCVSECLQLLQTEITRTVLKLLVLQEDRSSNTFDLYSFDCRHYSTSQPFCIHHNTVNTIRLIPLRKKKSNNSLVLLIFLHSFNQRVYPLEQPKTNLRCVNQVSTTPPLLIFLRSSIKQPKCLPLAASSLSVPSRRQTATRS